MQPLRFLLLVPLSFFAACAAPPSTMIASSETNLSYRGGPLRSVLVVGIANMPAVRSPFENALADTLNSYGVRAIESFTIIPSSAPVDSATLQRTMKEYHIETVSITRRIAEKHTPAATPSGSRAPAIDPVVNDLYNYYITSVRDIYTPTSVTTKEAAVLETHVYNAADGKLIWSAKSRSTADLTEEKPILALAKALVDRMRQEKLIR